MQLDPIDRQIIQLTQHGLPLTAEPYQAIAEQLGLTSVEVKNRFAAMLHGGIIRRIAAVPNHYRLGYRYNGMGVWDVDDKHIDAMGEIIGQLEFVSHCYHRPRHLPLWPYNLFAMVHGKTQRHVDRKIARIAEILAETSRAFDVLYSSKILKKTGFRMTVETAKNHPPASL